MLKKSLLYLVTVSILAFLAGCSAGGPRVDYLPSFKKMALKTFAVEKSPDADIDPLNAERIAGAIEGNLRHKGYTSAVQPDFIARYDVSVVENVPSNVSFGFGIGSYGRHGGGSVGTSITPSRDRVAIRIDMVDPRTRKVFWSTSTQKSMPDFTTPESRRAFFNAVVYELLKPFPEAKR
ncbi:DUF4136 domain-containing protein [Hydrogenimonas sp. SS33]|uniref:DUF4136 domain-containing protein n=1 Tax=Hydrogenimonas leucolamina TaxID=2954236 RepID=UPI00336C03B0